MSKVILKIGPSTTHVEQDDINIIEIGERPKTTIKYAKDHSVIFFGRNPFYAVITEPTEVKDICHFLERHVEADNEAEARKYIGMACLNIESLIAAYISRNLFDDFSESLIKALRNSKQIGYNQALKNETTIVE